VLLLGYVRQEAIEIGDGKGEVRDGKPGVLGTRMAPVGSVFSRSGSSPVLQGEGHMKKWLIQLRIVSPGDAGKPELE